MKSAFKQLAVLALVGAAIWAFAAWPLLNDVETGRTPEYPQLQVKMFLAGEDKVARGVEQTIKSLPGWTLVGMGHGPGGTSIQAVREGPVFGLKDDVTVRIWREGGMTRLSVRSRSQPRVLDVKLDFGQNARNIRELLDELSRQML